MMSGWVRLHRGWETSDKFKSEPYCERAAWCWLLSNAAWKETIRVGGKGDEVTISPGQIHISDRSLATVWGWDKKRVRRFLTKLERSKSATINRTGNGTILTLENWGLYQKQGPTEGPSEGSTEDQPGTTQEEGKEGKEGKEEKNTHYAFSGRTVKLNAEDYQCWKDRYHAIADLDSTLGALDDWISDESEPQRKKWFNIVSGALNKKHLAMVPAKQIDTLEFGPC